MIKVSFAVWVIFVVVSCSSQKHISTNESSLVNELRDSISTLNLEYNKLYSENLQLQYASISFDTIRTVDTQHVTNTVYITKEGEIKSSGKIIKVIVSNATYTKIISEWERRFDSLRLVKSKVEVKTVVKEVEKKVTFLPWWFWLVVCGSILFGLKNNILKLFKL